MIRLKLVDSAPIVRILPHDPERRGYVITYEGASTRCPGCGRTNWLVGRLMAECGFERCRTAIPIGERR